MRSHGLNMEGKFISNKVSTLPSSAAAIEDECREIYVEDEGKRYFSDGSDWVKYTSNDKRVAVETNYNPQELTTDYIIGVTNTDAARSVIISDEDLASGSVDYPRIMIIKDESGGAGTNNITISFESGENIDGSASFVINLNYQSITLYMIGTCGFVF